MSKQSEDAWVGLARALSEAEGPQEIAEAAVRLAAYRYAFAAAPEIDHRAIDLAELLKAQAAVNP